MIEKELCDRTLKKVSWHLLPYLILIYMTCYLDRVNVGFAALTMNKDLGLTATAFGWGAGIFFLGYFLLEVPSNLMLEHFGARRWISRIMISWGIVTALMAFVQGSVSFFCVRFLLGATEAGFFPGVIFYLTFWFPARYRAKMVSRFMISTLVAAIIGGPISGAILGLDGLHGLAGWKWLFILEGVPTVLLGFITLYYLADRPRDAKWLTREESDWLERQTEEERRSVDKVQKYSLASALTSGKVLVLAFVYVTVQVGCYGISMWIPQIVKGFGGLTNLQVGFIAAIPFIFAAIGLLIIGYSSDRLMERRWHLVGALLAGTVGLIGASLTPDQPVLAIAFLSLGAMGTFGLPGVFWAIPPTFLTGTAAAAGIALINATGNLGGFIGPFAMGWLKDVTGSFSNGLVFLGSCVLLGAIAAYAVTSRIKAENAAHAAASTNPLHA